MPRGFQKTPLEDVLATRAHFKDTSKWPSRTPGNRLEPNTWPVLRPKFTLEPGSTIFTIGSCFARNIEEHLHAAGFRIPTLDFSAPRSEWPGRSNGILNKYTPSGILQELEWAAAAIDAPDAETVGRALAEPLLHVGDEQYVDLELAGYEPVSRERALSRRRELLDLMRSAFSADALIITLGLAEAWWDNARNQYMQQAPKGLWARRFPGRFSFKVLNFSDSYAMTRAAIDLILSRNPAARMLLTTSPVPIGVTLTEQDVIVSNTYAKSMLRTVCGEIAAIHPSVDYFPSYENVMLSKSPDVWMNDLIHVESRFVGEIVKRFIHAYCPNFASPG